MEYITVTQAQKKIAEIIDLFIETAAMQPGKLMASIEPMGMYEICTLFNRMKTDKKMLYVPGELDNDRITILYFPAPNCVIEIESEPLKKVRAIMPKNYKLN